MSSQLPQVTRIYQNHSLDSTRWEHFTPRDDDIIITTSYKSGTSWMQTIMQHLILPDNEIRVRKDLDDFSTWLDARWSPIEEAIDHIESQTHRRCIKSHLSFDGLPYYPQVKYIVVARDGRDVFMSFWNHYYYFTDAIFEMFDSTGCSMPRCPENIHQVWRDWTTRGWFDWESEGYPFWGNLHHTKTYWDYKDLPNVLLVHYNNLLLQPHAEIERIADFVNIEIRLC